MYFSRIKEINEELSRIAERKKRLEEELTSLEEKHEKEPELSRVKFNKYYTIRVNYFGVNITYETEALSNANDVDYEGNNYFPPEHKDFAEEVVKKFKFILFLARQKMIYCSDYKPDWNNTKEKKYCVYFDAMLNKYYFDYYCDYKLEGQIYFSTEEIAQKVCDKLNSELRKDV